MNPSEINQDPVQGEFFTSATDLPQRFVRESLQNSLDARSGTAPVRVRYTFSFKRWALPASVGKRYLVGLADHIQANRDSDLFERMAISTARQKLNAAMDWITVEDSGTRGLVGDVRANQSREKGNHFWGFFRSIGISPKSENEGGSWGLGKWVFPDASAINAYIGVTRRVGDDHTLVMGVAVQNTHTVNGRKYPPYGQFADDADEGDSSWLPLPVDSRGNPGFVDRICHDFKLERGREPGLSVIVPFPKAGLDPDAIAQAVIMQYFLPIVRGDLVVEIATPESARVLDAASIEREVFELQAAGNPGDEDSPESLAAIIRLARWTTEVADRDHTVLPVPMRKREFLSDSILTGLRAKYESGGTLALEFQSRVERREGSAAGSRFRMYVQQDEALQSGHDYFVRGNLSVSGMNHIGQYKARSLTIVDGDSPLGHLLRDSEGPAHLTWNPQSQRLKDRWVGGYSRVQEVRRACALLLQKLVQKPEERQLDALADLFPVESGNRHGRGGHRRGGTEPGRDPLPPARRSPFNVSAAASGFRVGPSAGQILTGTEWMLAFAYDVVRGDPFTRYDQGAYAGIPDFVIGNGRTRIDIRGGRIAQEAGNRLSFIVDAESFELRVYGLDGRDVIVELRPIRESSSAGIEHPDDATGWRMVT